MAKYPPVPEPQRHVPFKVEEEYLKRYKWRTSIDSWILTGPTALVTFKDLDILLELVDGVPRLIETDGECAYLYEKFHPCTKNVAKYVRMWTKSGFYKSMHLKEFLDQILLK